MRFEWGSVQMKPASIRRTLLRPLSFLRQMARSSRDSGSAIVHVWGGEKKRSQFLQKESVPVRCTMSICTASAARRECTLFWDSFRDIDAF